MAQLYHPHLHHQQERLPSIRDLDFNYQTKAHQLPPQPQQQQVHPDANVYAQAQQGGNGMYHHHHYSYPQRTPTDSQPAPNTAPAPAPAPPQSRPPHHISQHIQHNPGPPPRQLPPQPPPPQQQQQPGPAPSSSQQPQPPVSHLQHPPRDPHSLHPHHHGVLSGPPPQMQQQQQPQQPQQQPPTQPPSSSSPATRAALRQSCIPKIHEHCMTLYAFANRFAQLQATTPNVQPTQAEITEMARRASQVISLIEELRKLSVPEHDGVAGGGGGVGGVGVESGSGAVGGNVGMAAGGGSDPAHHPHHSQQHHGRDRSVSRVPKRPWEDMARDEGDASAYPPSKKHSSPSHSSMSPEKSPVQSMAEKDMALIRSKRATNTGAGGAAAGPGGVAKGKYRKRSRATPPGKCHSCNIRETPEWRRGPDGARTLCNACGLR